jgi:hypothetical protein
MRADFPEPSDYWKDRYVAVSKDMENGEMVVKPKQVPPYDRPARYAAKTGGS